ncbi:MAG TPA: EAL domain-containing protein [Candidatus Dormibacteraeota bacterium]|jgi:diguanylate cyclase (GGDEF)-like protein|nr:EAL domain-containing protein [Candidatus Dormibacteraeota bacterium]
MAEVWVVHLQFRQEAHTVSLSEIPLVLGLFFLAPRELIAAQLAGAVPALALHRRQAPVKLAFNLAQLALSAGVAALAFHAGIGANEPVEPLAWAAALGATTLASLVGVLAISVVISISEGRLSLASWGPVTLFALGGTLVNTCLGLVGTIILFREPRATVLLLVPAGALYAAYRAYTRERQKTERIEFLYRSGRTLSRAAETDAGILTLLREALRMFRAEAAEVVILPSGGSLAHTRTAVRGDQVVAVDQPIQPSPADAVLEDVMARDAGLILDRGGADGRALAFLTERGFKDAVITSLKAENRVIGTILVGNRMGAVSTFHEDDLHLLATLATQVGAAVENSRLERTLKHEAFHDSLTNLANRRLFTERVDHALLRRESRVAVLLVDVDDFKAVNDTLGHNVGDQLLISVAQRLSLCVRGTDTAARIGGDEFAVVIEDLADLADAAAAAVRIINALREPFALAGQQVRCGASIGIATNLEQETDGGTLLLQADVAMYSAKRAGKAGYHVFEPSMQAEVRERHLLREDLHLALERGELVNHYQPVVALDGRTVLGAEALVRWRHPERGLVSPAFFISVAEETGLIVELGRQVLAEACREARQWQRDFPLLMPLTVSVNLSPRQLQQEGFVDEVVRTLGEAGLDPRHLTLEITESTFMEDTRTAITRLRELRGLGVRLAIDDFGTGYSSLSILRELPLDVLKIDKSFVDGIRDVEDRPPFLQAIVSLAQALDLDMVAEGIEAEAQAEALTALGCQRGQGYLFAKPLPAAEMADFLRLSAEALEVAEPAAVIPIRQRRR